MADIVAADTLTLHCRCARCEATGSLPLESGTPCPACEGRGAWEAKVSLAALVDWIAGELRLDPPLMRTWSEQERGITVEVLRERQRRRVEETRA